MTHIRAFPVELFQPEGEAKPGLEGSVWFGMWNATPPSLFLWWLILKGFGVL